jgi:hypothetical protein
MRKAAQKLGRVLVRRWQDKTRTRPSFRPPPEREAKVDVPKGRFAALRHFRGRVKTQEGCMAVIDQ